MMEEIEENPVLLACLPLSSNFSEFKKIVVSSGDFTLGRSLANSVCIPMGLISRKHCTFKKTDENEWFVEDHSLAGIKINDEKVGKGSKKKLEHEDIIVLEPSEELQYKFILPSLDVFERPRKRMKMTVNPESTMIHDVKLKFEESQKCEMQHIEDKIQNAKQMQSTSIILKKQLQEDMNRKLKQLEDEFSVQIENLKGEKNEVEHQRASLIEERDAQLTNVKNEMEGKITELMEQISKHNENESELLKENGLLKEKLLKEREDFLSELNRESSSKQDMLDKLEAKIREQEDVRMKERQELENTLRQETELLKLAKEKELNEMAELKRLRETELQQELTNMKQNLADQVEQTEQQRIKAEQELKIQIEQMNKLQAEEKAKMEQFQKERDEIQKKLAEAQMNVMKSKEEVQARVLERETELAALASERIQKQVEQSSEAISTLQMQLEKVISDLRMVETEKNTLLENICMDPAGEGTSKQETLNEFGELMESELQCSVCAELFVEATTLNCSHTFCKYCITMWKKKKKDCPICRSPITSECRSLVLDSFIEKMVQSLTEEMKTKRQGMLKFRAAEEQSSSKPATTNNSRRRRANTTNTANTTRRGTSRRSTAASGRVPTTTATPVVDLTMLPIPMSPTVQPPLVPAQMTLMQPQQSRQIGVENLTRPRQVPTVDLTQSPVSQAPRRTIAVHHLAEMLLTSQLRPHQGRQYQIENQAVSLAQTLDLTGLPISRITTGERQTSTVPMNTRQMATDLADVRQNQTDNRTRLATIQVPTGNRLTRDMDMTHVTSRLATIQVPTGNRLTRDMDVTSRLATAQTAMDNRQMSTVPTNMLQMATDLTDVRQNQIDNRTRLATIQVPTGNRLTRDMDMTHVTSRLATAQTAMDNRQMSTVPTNTLQMATDLTDVRQNQTGNQTRLATIQVPTGNRLTRDMDVTPRLAIAQTAMDNRQMSTVPTNILQMATDLTDVCQNQTDNQTRLATIQVPTGNRLTRDMDVTHVTSRLATAQTAMDNRQMSTVPTNTLQMATDLTDVRQNQTGNQTRLVTIQVPTGNRLSRDMDLLNHVTSLICPRQTPTVAGPMPPMPMNPTVRPRGVSPSARQGRQCQIENQAASLVRTLDLTELPISRITTGERQMSTVPMNTRQMATDLTDARQNQTGNQTRLATNQVLTGNRLTIGMDVTSRLATAQTAMDNRQMSTDTRQNVTYPRGAPQISTAAGPMPPTSTNPTERPKTKQMPPQQGGPIEIENLTTETSGQVPIMIPTTPLINQTTTTETPTMRPIHHQRVRAVGGVTSLASLAPTTAAMGVASHAAPEAIGPPVAPSDNQNRPS